MSLGIVKLLRPIHRLQDWTNDELAEFYRIEASLIRNGISVETDRGVSDEGHPWFVFCRSDTGDVILHLARLDGHYLAASPVFGGSVRGPDFKSLIQCVIGSQLQSVVRVKNANVYTHPSAALIALISICYFKMQAKEAVASVLPQTSKLMAHSRPRIAGESSGEGRASPPAERHDSADLAALIGVALSQSDGGGDPMAIAAPATHLFIPVTQSMPLPSLHAIDLANWIDQRPHALDDLVYVEQGKANGSASLPVVLGGSVAHPPNAETLIQFNSGVEQPDNSGSGVQLATDHHSFVTPLISVPVSLTVTAPDSAASVLGSSLSPSELILTTSVAGREVIAVLGDLLQTHFIDSMGGAGQDFILSLAEHAVPAISFDSASATSASPATASSLHPSSLTSSGPSSPGGAGDNHWGPQTTSDGAALSAEVAAATKMITQFESAHPDFAVMDQGKEVIIYDTHLTASNYSTAVHETFSFADGSSIFLVGLPAATNHEGPWS